MGWRSTLAATVAGVLLVTTYGTGGSLPLAMADTHTTGTQQQSEISNLIESMASAKLIEEEPITSGAIRKKYQLQYQSTGHSSSSNITPSSSNNITPASSDGATPQRETANPILHGLDHKGPVEINVVEVDLTNPYVRIDTIAGKGGKVAVRDNVSDLAKESGAVAATNADFFVVKGDGAPLGPQMTQGEWVTSPAKLDGVYSLGITAEGKAEVALFTFDGKVVGPDGAAFPLSGMNKSLYWQDPDGKISHVDELHLYTSAWGKKARGTGTYTTPTEALVTDGMITQISFQKALDMTPPEGSVILRGHGKAAEFMKKWVAGDKVNIDYKISPEKDWLMVIGGHGLLVDQGRPVPYTRDAKALGGHRARTAVGHSQDGKTLYMITVEGNNERSVGMTLEELSAFMTTIGVWRGMNMDGGGSTTMVARPLGESTTQPVIRPEQGTERLVPNALGIYSIAPKGNLAGIKVKGPELLLINEQAQYEAYGYDSFYNPWRLGFAALQWGIQGDQVKQGEFDKQRFSPIFPGKYRVTATNGSIKGTLDIEVIGRQGIKKLAVSPSSLTVSPGDENQLEVSVTTRSGEKRRIPSSYLQWEVYGMTALISEQGVLRVAEGTPGQTGYVVARYDEFSTMVPVTLAEERTFVNFEQNTEVSFQSSQSEVTGTFQVESESTHVPNRVGVLAYNFSGGSGTKAVYARFGQEGMGIEGTPMGMSLRVYGDNGLHWLRAEATDVNGKLHRMDLAKSVNWTGWKTLQVDLPASAYDFPLILQRIYLANIEQGQDERALEGKILIDDISFQYGRMPEEPLPVKIQVAIGKDRMTFNGESFKMQIAPVIIGQSTYVPVRDLAEILGAEVLYYHPSRRVSFYKGGQWIDIWQNDRLMIANGYSQTLPTPVTNRSGVTMVPLRMLSETFGLKVDWDAATRTVTLTR